MPILKSIAVCLFVVCFVVGCQQKVSPVPAPPAGNTTNAAGGTTDALSDANSTTVTDDAGAQSDDPGMTIDRDKTASQELPSGDESSKAAPNEGDAEPPQ